MHLVHLHLQLTLHYATLFILTNQLFFFLIETVYAAKEDGIRTFFHCSIFEIRPIVSFLIIGTTFASA